MTLPIPTLRKWRQENRYSHLSLQCNIASQKQQPFCSPRKKADLMVRQLKEWCNLIGK